MYDFRGIYLQISLSDWRTGYEQARRQGDGGKGYRRPVDTGAREGEEEEPDQGMARERSVDHRGSEEQKVTKREVLVEAKVG